MFHRPSDADIEELRDFLILCDLTIAGLDDPLVRLWMIRDENAQVIGSTGYELSPDRSHALVRSVAVHPTLRRAGDGRRYAEHALRSAQAEGAETAWLFSRRSGPFWESLGFEPGDREELAAVLGETSQVRLFVQTGQLEREVAWRRSL